ncbi:potassium-transporting ATPase subunit KdpC [Aceticella autotrophica]|uniref:Potassium-transporting ATPase KdpC subunit n=1 Tax=Aceticella autotrophica TaxID=2755338 RepID=A0A975GAQ0_9THEO|nr:potassium-transporting ATPase subunit KdpC [Aceticella autotrophica]QSZ27520.1 potassium-transporting ATPase subunit KdpC [Aceticella autotrophica]
MIKNTALRAALLLIVMTLLLGLIYPLTVTGVAQILFHNKANGSMIVKNGKIIGSKLIGQNFKNPAYFHGRPSAAGKDGYDATASSGSNLGPTNKALIDDAKKLSEQVRKENEIPENQPVPSDLITSSASGLDPDISIDAAYVQIPRIAKIRGISEGKLKELVNSHITGRQFGILGEKRVNVLMLNTALDDLKK